MSEHSVIYLAPSDDPEREWCQDDVWENSVRYNLGYDFDRVTAKRDAALAENKLLRHGVASYLETVAKVCDMLGVDLESAKTAEGKPSDVLFGYVSLIQQRLTAADERVSALEGLLQMFIDNSDDGDVVELCRHALKPAEAPINQCDGCQAGIPVVNGAHRMGKPGAYPDTMSCTAKLYKP